MKCSYLLCNNNFGNGFITTNRTIDSQHQHSNTIFWIQNWFRHKYSIVCDRVPYYSKPPAVSSATTLLRRMCVRRWKGVRRTTEWKKKIHSVRWATSSLNLLPAERVDGIERGEHIKRDFLLVLGAYVCSLTSQNKNDSSQRGIK